MFCRKITCLGRCMGKVCHATVGRWSRLCSDHGRIVPTMKLTFLGFPLCSGMAPSSLLVAVAHVVLWSFATCLQIAVEWLRQGCHAWFLWVVLVFGVLHFPLRFPFKDVSKSYFVWALATKSGLGAGFRVDFRPERSRDEVRRAETS